MGAGYLQIVQERSGVAHSCLSTLADIDLSKKDRFTITVDKNHTVAQLVRALLANSKVSGSSPGGVTDDFFLSFTSGLQVLSFGEKRAVRGMWSQIS